MPANAPTTRSGTPTAGNEPTDQQRRRAAARRRARSAAPVREVEPGAPSPPAPTASAGGRCGGPRGSRRILPRGGGRRAGGAGDRCPCWPRAPGGPGRTASSGTRTWMPSRVRFASGVSPSRCSTSSRTLACSAGHAPRSLATRPAPRPPCCTAVTPRTPCGCALAAARSTSAPAPPWLSGDRRPSRPPPAAFGTAVPLAALPPTEEALVPGMADAPRMYRALKRVLPPIVNRLPAAARRGARAHPRLGAGDPGLQPPVVHRLDRAADQRAAAGVLPRQGRLLGLVAHPLVLPGHRRRPGAPRRRREGRRQPAYRRRDPASGRPARHLPRGHPQPRRTALPRQDRSRPHGARGRRPDRARVRSSAPTRRCRPAPTGPGVSRSPSATAGHWTCRATATSAPTRSRCVRPPTS